MTSPADTVAVVSRLNLAAGLAVRLIDHAAERPAGRRGVVFVVTMFTGDVAGAAAHVAAERPWAVITLPARTTSPAKCLRQLAVLLDADHTGNQAYLTRQIYDVLDDREGVAVVVVAGDAAVRPCFAALELLAGHPRLIVAILTTRGTAACLGGPYALRQRPMTFHADTPAERDKLGHVILRFGRFKRRRGRT